MNKSIFKFPCWQQRVRLTLRNLLLNQRLEKWESRLQKMSALWAMIVFEWMPFWLSYLATTGWDFNKKGLNQCFVRCTNQLLETSSHDEPSGPEFPLQGLMALLASMQVWRMQWVLWGRLGGVSDMQWGDNAANSGFWKGSPRRTAMLQNWHHRPCSSYLWLFALP